MAKAQPTTTQPKKPSKVTAVPITHTALGKIYVTHHAQNTMFARGRWYRYELGVWSPIPDFEIEMEIWRLLEMHEGHPHYLYTTNSIKKSVLSYVQTSLSISEDRLDAYPNLINLRNGIYNLDTGQLIPHDPVLLLTSQLPFDFNEHAIAPMFTAYIHTTFSDKTGQSPDPELISLIQESIGYSLTTDMSHQVMFWCIGEGENGKGVLFHVLEQLGGTSATPLDLNGLKKERYQLATLIGKRIALCSEANTHDNLVEDATIKALVAGDAIQVRQIRREPFILYPQAKLWWSMNRLPAITDTSHGFWRRMKVIPFNKIFSDGDRINDLKERLDKELPGIFNWSLIGLNRLRNVGKFTACQQTDLIKDKFQKENNTLRLFIEDTCIEIQGAKTQTGLLYTLYKEWAQINGYKAMSNRTFKQELEALKFYYFRDNAMRFYSGLLLDEKKCNENGLTYHPHFQQKSFI